MYERQIYLTQRVLSPRIIIVNICYRFIPANLLIIFLKWMNEVLEYLDRDDYINFVYLRFNYYLKDLSKII